jgi:hypothetical protein
VVALSIDLVIACRTLLRCFLGAGRDNQRDFIDGLWSKCVVHLL